MRKRLASHGAGVSVLGLFLLLIFWVSPADAYAWMVRHDYTGCNQCHADPSGGSLLTDYGRAQSDFLLRMRYGAPESYEPPRSAEFLFGVVKLPPSLLLGGAARYATLQQTTNGESKLSMFLMQADLTAQVTAERVRVNGSIGYAERGARETAITHSDEKNLVSRVHWVGVDVGADKNWLLRAGRMNLPFGLRMVEHTLWARSTTRTDTNVAQQHGAALAYNGPDLRGELMLIAGNFQVAPDAFRERGYSGYVEYAKSPRLAYGVSSLVTYAKRDLASQESLVRHAHGAFARYNPVKPLVLLAEADLLAEAPEGEATATGHVGMLQADVEVTQGLHVLGTAEWRKLPTGFGTATGFWGSVVWFFAPHFDVRGDVIYQSAPTSGAASESTTLLAQLHAFL